MGAPVNKVDRDVNNAELLRQKHAQPYLVISWLGLVKQYSTSMIFDNINQGISLRVTAVHFILLMPDIIRDLKLNSELYLKLKSKAQAELNRYWQQWDGDAESMNDT